MGDEGRRVWVEAAESVEVVEEIERGLGGFMKDSSAGGGGEIVAAVVASSGIERELSCLGLCLGGCALPFTCWRKRSDIASDMCVGLGHGTHFSPLAYLQFWCSGCVL